MALLLAVSSSISAAPAKKPAAAVPPGRAEIDAEVERLWRDKSFEALEALDASYSDPAKVDPDGYPLRDLVDQALRMQLAAVALSNDRWEATRTSIYQWIDKSPRSPLANVTLANLYAARAWRIRGFGSGSTVSAAQWDGFNANVKLQRTVLESTRDVSQNHPGWYLSMARVLQWTSAPEPEYRAVISEGLARFPASFALHAAAVDRYSWKWGGQSGGPERFARQASERLPARSGDEMYAKLYGYTVQEHPSEISEFDCARVMRGFEQVVSRHGTSFNRHQAARAAYECKDRARIRRFLRGAGGPPPSSVWGVDPQGSERFKEAKKWGGLP